MMARSACSLRGRPGRRAGPGSARPAACPVPAPGGLLSSAQRCWPSLRTWTQLSIPAWAATPAGTPQAPAPRRPRARQARRSGLGLRGRGLSRAARHPDQHDQRADQRDHRGDGRGDVHRVHEGGVTELVEAQSRVTQLGGHGVGSGDGARRGVLGGGGQRGQVRAELAPVDLGQDGAQHRDAKCPSDLAGGVGQRRAGAGPLPGHHGHDGLGGRRHHGAHARALHEEDHGQHPDRRAHPEQQVAAQRDRHGDQPGRGDGLGAVPPDQPGTARRHQHLARGERQGEHARVQRGVAAHALQVEAEEEQRAHHAEEDQPEGADRGGQPGVAEQLHVQRRVAEPGLVPAEQGQHRQSGDGDAEHVPVDPGALLAALDDAVHHEHQADDGHQPRPRSRSGPGWGSATPARAPGWPARRPR